VKGVRNVNAGMGKLQGPFRKFHSKFPAVFEINACLRR
jgi:hypothetical protein